MKAVVKEKKGVGNIVFKDVPEPIPGPNEIKVKVEATGVCGTDIHIYHDAFRNIPPVIIGHEFSGVVVDKGSNVKLFNIGDRVTAEPPARLCGVCRHCRTGRYNLCSNRLGLGSGMNGSFAEYCLVEEKMAYALPENISFREGALCEPLACVMHAVQLTGVGAGEVVVVIGPGPMGLLTVQAALAEGAQVIVIGTAADEDRLKLAAQFGCHYIINIDQKDPLEEILNLTDSIGADIVFECSGNENAANMGLQIVRKGGKYTQVGLFGKPITIDFEKITLKEVIVTGNMGQHWSSWRKALALLKSGKIRLAPLITDEFRLADWEQAFATYQKKEGLKVILYPNR